MNCFTVSDQGNIITSYNNITCPKDVIIPEKIKGIIITEIWQSAFNNRQLTSVVIPDSVTRIAVYAFRTNNITSIILPRYLTYYGRKSFYNNMITSLSMPDTVTYFGNWEILMNNWPNRNSDAVTGFVKNTSQSWILSGTSWILQ